MGKFFEKNTSSAVRKEEQLNLLSSAVAEFVYRVLPTAKPTALASDMAQKAYKPRTVHQKSHTVFRPSCKIQRFWDKGSACNPDHLDVVVSQNKGTPI